jgi:hypothetical protein
MTREQRKSNQAIKGSRAGEEEEEEEEEEERS